jgi:hypothetical protein
MFTIEYGPKGNRIAVSGLKLSQVVPAAEALIEGGALDLRILDREGKSHDLPEFKLGLGLIVIS